MGAFRSGRDIQTRKSCPSTRRSRNTRDEARRLQVAEGSKPVAALVDHRSECRRVLHFRPVGSDCHSGMERTVDGRNRSFACWLRFHRNIPRQRTVEREYEGSSGFLSVDERVARDIARSASTRRLIRAWILIV